MMDVRVGDRVKIRACSTGFWAVVQEILPRQFRANGVRTVYMLANEDGTFRGEYARSEFVVPRGNCRLCRRTILAAKNLASRMCDRLDCFTRPTGFGSPSSEH
jgi:hypothetical protein